MEVVYAAFVRASVVGTLCSFHSLIYTRRVSVRDQTRKFAENVFPSHFALELTNINVIAGRSDSKKKWYTRGQHFLKARFFESQQRR